MNWLQILHHIGFIFWLPILWAVLLCTLSQFIFTRHNTGMPTWRKRSLFAASIGIAVSWFTLGLSEGESTMLRYGLIGLSLALSEFYQLRLWR